MGYDMFLHHPEDGHPISDPVQLSDLHAWDDNPDIFQLTFPEWQNQAACLGSDPDIFFAEKGRTTDEARRICYGCPVRKPCLEYALTAGQHHGVWGGTSERQRRKMRRLRAQRQRRRQQAA